MRKVLLSSFLFVFVAASANAQIIIKPSTSGGGGAGTVTSVAATVPTGLSITGSPITTDGTLAITLTSGYMIPGGGTDGYHLRSNGASAPTWEAVAAAGTVTSVAATVPTLLSVGGSPITTDGTLALTWDAASGCIPYMSALNTAACSTNFTLVSDILYSKSITGLNTYLFEINGGISPSDEGTSPLLIIKGGASKELSGLQVVV